MSCISKNTNSAANLYHSIEQREYRRVAEPPDKIWNRFGCSPRVIHTLSPWGELHGHEGCVNVVAFNKSGSLLLSGSDDSEVKIWDPFTRQCLTSLSGHISNVFAADFLPHKNDKEIVTGGNDADVRYYEIEKKICTVYQHHSKKVLRLSVNPMSPDTFLTCSADGTVRMFDIRMKYSHSYVHSFSEEPNNHNDYILPQAFGGGRATRNNHELHEQSLILDYKCDIAVTRNRRNPGTATLFSVDFHPFNGYHFIVGSSFGDVRLYDLRKINKPNPGTSYLNIFRNYNIALPHHYEVTGCVYSRDGTQIVSTSLNDHIYVFDVNRNYEKEYNLDYFATFEERRRQIRAWREQNKQVEVFSDDPVPKIPHDKCYELLPSHIKLASVVTYIVDHDFLKLKLRHAEKEQTNASDSSVQNGTPMTVSENSNETSSPNGKGKRKKQLEKENTKENTTESVENTNINESHNEAKDNTEEKSAKKPNEEPKTKRQKVENEPSSKEQQQSSTEDSDDTEESDDFLDQTYMNVYKGHVSINTIKGVNFFGPNSEYVMSGSDDARVYIWDKKTAELLNVLEGHHSVVNCVVAHPTLPLIASSGIDNFIILWGPIDDMPSPQVMEKRRLKLKRLIIDHADAYKRETEGVETLCQTQ
jgi:WD40 repeat protein